MLRSASLFAKFTPRLVAFRPYATQVLTCGAESIQQGQVWEWQIPEGSAVKENDVVCFLEADKGAIEARAPYDGVITKHYAAKEDWFRVGHKLYEIEKEVATPELNHEPTHLLLQGNTKPDVPFTQLVREGPTLLIREDKVSNTKSEIPIAVPIAVPSNTPSRSERIHKMSSIRSQIAKRLKDSQNTAAMLTTFNEIDMTNFIELRTKHKDQFERTHGIKLGFMSAFVKASATALLEYPIINARTDGENIIYHDYVDISIAISAEKGLVVPVIRNAELMGFARIERAIVDFSSRAKSNKISFRDMVGGTFTISNGGTFGSMMGTPIINPPQSAILGMHAITQRAHVVGSEIKIRPIMFVALTYDHRLIDGREAVSFLKRIKTIIEDPQVLLLDI